MIKRLFLLAVLCLLLGMPSFALQIQFVSKDEALAVVESKFEGKDVDIYYINSTLASSTWDFFVDAEPLKGWEHECYINDVLSLLIHLVMPETLPVGHHPCLAVALSAAKPTDCSPPHSRRFPTGNHQPCSQMIPPETSDFASLSGGIASLNHRLNIDDALRATSFSVMPGYLATGLPG